jgi:hypothetical protein
MFVRSNLSDRFTFAEVFVAWIDAKCWLRDESFAAFGDT